MPMVSYFCNKCQKSSKKFFSKANQIHAKMTCECGGELVRQLSAPSQRSKMVIDNGVQAKATELDREIVEIIEDRQEADLKKRGDSVLENLK